MEGHRGVRQIFGGTVAAKGEGLVGATLVVARVGAANAGFAGTGRHKGVPYDGPAMLRRQWPLTKDLSYTRDTVAG